MSESHLDTSVIDKAENLVGQGRVSEAWAVLGNAGDRYAAAAAKITHPDIMRHGVLGIVVRNFWDAQIGEHNRVAKWDDVAARHLKNYINQLRDHPGQLPKSTFIEESYNKALNKSGLPKSLSIDNVLNIVTADRQFKGKLFGRNFEIGIDPPDWHQWLGLRADRSVNNSGNKAENVSIPGLIGKNALEYGKDIVEPLADVAHDAYGFIAKQFQRTTKPAHPPLDDRGKIKPDRGSETFGSPGARPRRVVLGGPVLTATNSARLRGSKSAKIPGVSSESPFIEQDINLWNPSEVMSEQSQPYQTSDIPGDELRNPPETAYFNGGGDFLRAKANRPRRVFHPGRNKRARRVTPVIARFS